MPRTDPIVVASPEAVGEEVATRIADAIQARRDRPFVLGSPTGRTPEPVFAPLAALLAARHLDPNLLTVVLMDEYLTPDLELVDPSVEYSCVGYAERVIAAPIRERCGSAPRIWHADADDPGDYDRRIAEAGGVDLFLLASGASDGHIAFNQPGSERTSRTRVIELEEKTRRDNVETWPSITSIDEVPTHGVGVGISTIVDLSASAIMMITGAHKSYAFQRVTNASGYEPDWPATAVAEIENHIVVADTAAAGRTN
jgi:glucosamine-6-phosphate deaminase